MPGRSGRGSTSGGSRPGLLAPWESTDLRDYVAALHERCTTDTATFGLVLHWHDLRRIHRQVAGTRA